MKRSALVGFRASCFLLGLGLTSPLLAAEPQGAGTANPPSPASAIEPAEKCLTDLGAFNSQMRKDGYWLGESGYGYGYPMDGPGYGNGYPMGGGLEPTATGYQDARQGYDVRTLIAADR